MKRDFDYKKINENLNKITELYNLYPVVPITGGIKNPLCPWKNEENHLYKSDKRLQDPVWMWKNKQGQTKRAYKTGYAILTGSKSGIIVIDLDIGHGNGADGIETFEKLCNENLSKEDKDIIKNTLISVTPRGGKHLYFKSDKEISSNANYFPGIDIKSHGGAVPIPYTVVDFNDKEEHIQGRYSVNVDAQIQPIPIKLFDLLYNSEKNSINKIKETSKEGQATRNEISKFKEGSRNDSLMRELSRYINYPCNRNFDTLFSLATGINLLKCNPPLELSEVETITKSVLLRYKMPEYFDDKGNVIPSILAKRLCKDKNYRQYQKTNYIFNGKHYEEIQEDEIIQNWIREILPESKQRVRTLNEVMALMKISNTVTENEKKNLVNTKSGLLNLDTFEIIENNASYFTTFQVPAYFPSRKKYEGSKFQRYIQTTFWEGAEELIQEVLGVGLLPNPKKLQKCIFLLGEGSNGKSVFINLIKALNGDNVSTVPLKDIDSNRFALASMIGKNVNIDADASGLRLEETSNFKKITSGDEVHLERKGKQGTNGVLRNVMYIGLNKMPSTADKSHGFIRRNIIIPFEVEFVDPEEYEIKKSQGRKIAIKDKNLEEEIVNNEMDIVFEFALDGLKRMIKNNYKFSENIKVENKIDEYKQEINSAYAFYKDNCKGSYVYESVRASVLYDVYREWCSEYEVSSPMTSTAFGLEMSKHYKKRRSSKGMIYFDVVLNEDIVNKVKYA